MRFPARLPRPLTPLPRPSIPLPRPSVPLPRPSIRLRLTAIYASLFLASGACLLAFTYLLVAHLTGIQPFAFNGSYRGMDIMGSIRPMVQAAEQKQAEAEKQRLLVVSGIALAIMAAASAGLGWLMAGRVLHPRRTITAAARRISALSLGQRLAMTGPQDELKELADTFDQLLGRLQASFAAQRQFIANVSHELRTPLARQRVLTQVALADPGATAATLRAAHERALASGAQQERLIEALLTLALSQRGLERRQPFDLTAVTDEVLLARQSQAQRLELKIDARLSQAIAVGDPGLAERLVANLIDNAMRHNVPAGWITVATGTRQGRAVLTVANSGPAVPPEQVSLLFQPFQRLAPDRAERGTEHGLGLGLSIVEAIAAAHDAGLTARPQPQGGLIIGVSFPAPQPHPVAKPANNVHYG